ncbi:IS607 family transposase [Massilia varians]
MESTLGIGYAAKLLGITVKTLQRWEREGRLVPAARTASNRRRYTKSQLRAAWPGSSMLRKSGGLNFGRKHFLALMDAIGRGEVATLVLAHRDRLTRFGFDWFAHHAALHGCELLVLNQERLSPEQEMVQDLMTIVHCFSSRLYGLRNYRRQLRAALESHDAAGAPDQD